MMCTGKSMKAVLLTVLSGVCLLVVGTSGWAVSPPPQFQNLEVDEELRRIFQQAEGVFQSINQTDSIALFSQVIAELETRASRGSLTSAERSLLGRSLSFRARANFNLGEEDAAGVDLRRMINVVPEMDMDRSRVSPLLLEVFDNLRDQLVGYLQLAVFPSDAVVRIDGKAVESFVVTVAVLAGMHAVSVERPGYTVVQEEIEVAAGGQVLFEKDLERISAVYRIVTRPPGASVSLDGSELGLTAGTAPIDFVPPPIAAVYPRSDFSDYLVIEGLIPGRRHQLDVTLAGYRPKRVLLDVEDLGDYDATVVLDKAEGIVVLEGLPQDAVVTVDGEPVQPQRPSDGSPRLVLAPGDYAIGVTRGTAGVFESDVSVRDQQSQTLAVRLRAGVSFLGVLGGDERGARDLTRGLMEQLGALDNWVLLDRSARGSSVLEGVRADVSTLRDAADTTSASLDWRAIQAAVDDQVPGAVYLVGVLSDDLLATHADLWVWTAAPGPAQPDRWRISLDDPGALTEVGEAFAAPVPLERAWFGALLADSDAAAGALVIDLTPAGPAEAAGLQPGDVIVSVGGAMVTSAGEARVLLSGYEPNAAVAVQLQRGGGTQILEVTLGSSPTVISPSDPTLIYSVVSALLASEPSDVDLELPDRLNWVQQLNLSAVLMRGGAWAEAVRVLRGIEAPTGPGLGQAAVDYWLGIALTALGPNYLESARQAFARAAAAPDARLFHHDGPWVAPRAKARLATLGAAQ